jgi:hypothetical protein
VPRYRRLVAAETRAYIRFWPITPLTKAQLDPKRIQIMSANQLGFISERGIQVRLRGTRGQPLHKAPLPATIFFIFPFPQVPSSTRKTDPLRRAGSL